MVRIKKNTDKNPLLSWDLEKLFLYYIGKSPISLSARQIEKNILTDNPGISTKGRITYVYDLEKSFFPIPLSDSVPTKILFNSDDLLKENEFAIPIYHVEIDSDFKDKLKRKIYQNYSSYFYYLDEDETRHRISLSDLEINAIPDGDQGNGKFRVTIIISNKKAMFYDQTNYIRILVTYQENIVKSDITEDTLNVRLYSKSAVENNEREIEISTSLKIPRSKSNGDIKKRILEIRALQLSIFSLGPHYIDVLPTDLPLNQYNLKIRPKLKYVLNLRGLLYFLSRCNIHEDDDLKKINEVIEKLCYSDEYIDLQNEIREKFREIREIKIERNVFETKEYPQAKQEYVMTFAKPRIKARFPFLSYYNNYMKCLPDKYMAKFLYSISLEYKDKLEGISINDLKYEITKKYLHLIRHSIANQLYARISYLGIEEEQWDALKKFNSEVATYITKIKNKEVEKNDEENNAIVERIERIDFERNLNRLVSSHSPVISIESILDVNQYGNTYLKIFQHHMVKNYSRYETDDDKKYSFIIPHFFIKEILLKEIRLKLGPNHSSNDLRKEMKKHGIPPDCFNGLKNWLIEHNK